MYFRIFIIMDTGSTANAIHFRLLFQVYMSRRLFSFRKISVIIATNASSGIDVKIVFRRIWGRDSVCMGITPLSLDFICV